MWIKSWRWIKRTLLSHAATFCLTCLPSNLGTAVAQTGTSPQQGDRHGTTGLELVILLDTNPDQRKVFALESNLASGVLSRLDQQDAVISVVTFGATNPALQIAGASSTEAIMVLGKIGVENKDEPRFSVHLTDGLHAALDQFTDVQGSKSLLVIAEGREDFRGKNFKQIVTKAQRLGVRCDVALVASHSLRGSKSVLSYGFDLSELARKTHGRSIEVGNQQEKLSKFVEHLSDSILGKARRS